MQQSHLVLPRIPGYKQCFKVFLEFLFHTKSLSCRTMAYGSRSPDTQGRYDCVLPCPIKLMPDVKFYARFADIWFFCVCSCWLSLEGGLLYAFVGPAAAVVLVILHFVYLQSFTSLNYTHQCLYNVLCHLLD